MRDGPIDQIEDRSHIFNASNDYRGVNTLILIAACGEWWKFKIAKRESYSSSSDHLLSDLDVEISSMMVDYNPALPKTPKATKPTYLCRHVDDTVVQDPFFSESVVI